jgi:hypothetical protein
MIIYYGPIKGSPPWVEQWFQQHPQFRSMHQRWVELVHANRPQTTDEIINYLEQAMAVAGFDNFELRGHEFWITVHDYDLDIKWLN